MEALSKESSNHIFFIGPIIKHANFHILILVSIFIFTYSFDMPNMIKNLPYCCVRDHLNFMVKSSALSKMVVTGHMWEMST
jgi:hypothetical protein